MVITIRRFMEFYTRAQHTKHSANQFAARGLRPAKSVRRINSPLRVPHKTSIVLLPPCRLENRRYVLPRPCQLESRRYAPPLPTGKSAVRPAPAPADWKTGGTPRPCQLENRRYAPAPTPADWKVGCTSCPAPADWKVGGTPCPAPAPADWKTGGTPLPRPCRCQSFVRRSKGLRPKHSANQFAAKVPRARKPAVQVGWRHAPSGHFSGRWGGAPVLAKKENVSIRR
jgi:hypothetical protein